MLSSRTPCAPVPIRTFMFYTLVIFVSFTFIFKRPSPQPLPTHSLRQTVIRRSAFVVGLHTHDPLLVFTFITLR